MKGKCPKRGTLLMKGVAAHSNVKTSPEKVRCPSCNSSWHRLSQLEWSE